MSASRNRRVLRRLGVILSLPLLTSAVWLMAAGPAVACSCVMPGPMSDYATAENAVFSGTAGSMDGRGVPVEVETWYHGAGAAPLVYLAKAGFGDGASCGGTVPTPGSGWIWVTFLAEGGGDPATSLCLPSAMLGTPEGEAMVADAAATFGGAPPPGAGEVPPEGAPTSPLPPETAPMILAATIGLGVLLILVVIVLGRRRPSAAQ